MITTSQLSALLQKLSYFGAVYCCIQGIDSRFLSMRGRDKAFLCISLLSNYSFFSILISCILILLLYTFISSSTFFFHYGGGGIRRSGFFAFLKSQFSKSMSPTPWEDVPRVISSYGFFSSVSRHSLLRFPEHVQYT